MDIRAYKNEDFNAVIYLLRLNTPAFFDPSEEEGLHSYLSEETEDYFVIEENGEILGAGGINYYPGEKLAHLSWDIIKPDLQGKGIGRKLTEHRIRHLSKNNHIDLIVVRTSQFAWKFYEKMGFKLLRIEKDFWAPNFDLYQMEQKNKRSAQTEEG